MQDEWEHDKSSKEHKMFMPVHQRLDPQAIVDDLAELGNEDMPQNDPYKDDSWIVETFHIIDNEPELTPEGGTSM